MRELDESPPALPVAAVPDPVPPALPLTEVVLSWNDGALEGGVDVRTPPRTSLPGSMSVWGGE